MNKLNSPEKRRQLTSAVFCGLLMVLLGASDALRGVFLPLFRSEFSLTQSQSSMIIMMSYVGNLLFLFIGGYIVDRVKRKYFMAVVMLMWMGALAVYVLTANYTVLLCAMIFSMGASTMLSTTINIITPLCFASAAFFVNFFNFLQGTGISGAQNIGGRFAEKISSWHIANAILLAGGIVCFVLLMFVVKIPENKPNSGTKASYADILKNPACIYLILLCGFYCIAEHGLQNWLVTYGSEYLSFSVSRSALFLSIFFGGITIGRLIFAPVVQKFGIMKSMSIYATIAAVLYISGILLRSHGIVLLCASGLALSVVWPTFVLILSSYYPSTQTGTAIGLITGISYGFDVVFNAFFGKLSEAIGFGVSIMILPAAIFLYCVVFFIMKKRLPLPKENN